MTYAAVIAADSPLVVLACNEASGALTNSGSLGGTATITGSPTYQQAGLLGGDFGKSILFGSSSHATVPTSGLPSGTHAITLEAWVSLPSLPGAVKGFWGIGTEVTNESWQLGIDSSNKLYAALKNGTELATAGAAVINTVYYLALTYDGTTVIFYVNGAAIASTNPATVNIIVAGCRFGCLSDGTSHPNADQQWGALYGTALSAARITAHYTAGVAFGIAGVANGSGSMAGYLSGLLSGAAVGTGSGVGQPLGFVSGVAQGAGSARGSLAALIAAYANGSSAANGSIAALLHGSLIGAGRGRGSLVYFGSVTTTLSDAPSVTTTIGDHDAIDEEIAA